jgi:hypothetical protein
MACQENHAISSRLYVSEIPFSAAKDLGKTHKKHLIRNAVVPHLKFGQGQLARRMMETVMKPIHNDHNENRQWISSQ